MPIIVETGFAVKIRIHSPAAPKARNMTARGKRRASDVRRPWFEEINLTRALKVRNIMPNLFRSFRASQSLCFDPRGDAPRSARRLPLAVIFRAFGAARFAPSVLRGFNSDFWGKAVETCNLLHLVES